MTIHRKSKRQKENAHKIAQELINVQQRNEQNDITNTKRFSKRSLEKRFELRKLARAYGIQNRIQKNRKRLSVKDTHRKNVSSKSNGNVDPYCDSDVDIIDSAHDKELRKIHEQHVRCEDNPFISHEFCKKQTDRSVNAILNTIRSS